ncbi:MAG TPA: PSD1 and planctomycete cytochrome C domain-containing protein [Verrucomicrobiae bacterium]
MRDAISASLASKAMSSAKFWLSFAAGIALLHGRCVAAPAPTNSAGIEFFESKVRPVLVDHCYKCHSHQSAKVRGGFLLDTRADLLKGGDSGPAIVPNHPEKSLLITAVNYTNPDLQMPPKDQKLSDDQIACLQTWIKMGAPDPRMAGTNSISPSFEAARKHWAFQPIVEPAVPANQSHKNWIKTPLDAFVLANLNAKGLRPNPVADKRTLIRRATFDLIGLPPTPAEVKAFIDDKSPDAFARVVDRLLASPHYGERWGRYWLDVARYADTKGQAAFRDSPRLPYAYTYRDYVIRSVNEDLPFNRFILEQLAADQLPRGTNDNRDLAAMGFLTTGRRFFENQNDIIDDRIDVVSRGLLGLTVSCARCHDHKFDPVPTRDYYALYGIFNSSYEPTNEPLLTVPLPAAYTNYLTDLATNKENMDSYVQSNELAVLGKLRSEVGDYLLAVHDATPFATNGLKTDELVRSRKLNKSVFLRWRTNLTVIGTNHSRLFSPWVALESQWTNGAMTFGDDVNPMIGEACSGIAFTNLQEVAEVYDKVFAQSATNSETNVAAVEVRQFLEASNSPANPPRAEFAKVFLFDDSVRNKIDTYRRRLTDVDATDPGAPPRAMVMLDKAQPSDSKIFLRGNPGTRGANAPRGFLEVLSKPGGPPFPKKVSGRLQLAEDIVSPQNPLTARVFVDRVWMHHFGTALVASPSDFGVRTERPVQAALLDYMAARFMRDGWSLKKLNRLIMLSSVYQQSSALNENAARIDPENACLWRMNPTRLDFEAMRDSMLAVAGELDSTEGGQPVDITSNTMPERRSVYAYIDRQNLPAMFRAFDFANPDTSSAERFQTIVAPQALFLLNSPLISQCARGVLGRCKATGAADYDARIDKLYELIYQRAPTSLEMEIGRDYLREQPTNAVVVPQVNDWEYGCGVYDEAAQRTIRFSTLPFFNGNAWVARAKGTDPALGSVQVNAVGGYPGKTNIAAIRRWVAPRDGTVSISGELIHALSKGDGVRGRIVSSRAGLLGEWKVFNNQAKTVIDSVEVEEGDTIDFMVDGMADSRADTFKWAPHIEMTKQETDSMEELSLPHAWDAKDDFLNPKKLPKPLGPWEKYAQVLLISNEFFFLE